MTPLDAAVEPGRPAPALIEFHDVHFAQGDVEVLKGVSFCIERGAITVVLGPSGTGKSTVLWLMLGLWRPHAGRITIAGRDATGFREEDWKAIRRRLSMVFQENALFDSLTVGENVGYCLLKNSPLSDDEIERMVRETLQLVELDPDLFIDRMPDELSGGQRRRVAIARAIADCDPQAIFYDEPTTGLDPATGRRIGDLILKLRDLRGTTSVVVTHEIADALRVGDRFILLDAGKVAYEGDAHGLLASTHSGVQRFLEPFVRSVEEILPVITEAVR